MKKKHREVYECVLNVQCAQQHVAPLRSNETGCLQTVHHCGMINSYVVQEFHFAR